jgi:hypothetical protein
MIFQGLHLLKTISTVALLAIGSASANAAHFTFSQGGFSGGGTVIGGFDAVDTDHNGWIDSWNDNDFKNFYLTFSGDSLVGDFSANHIARVTYKLGSGVIGMPFDGSPTSHIDTAEYRLPTAPYTSLYAVYVWSTGGGTAMDNISGATSTTSGLMVVSEVPLPGAAGLFACALAGLFARARKNLSTAMRK